MKAATWSRLTIKLVAAQSRIGAFPFLAGGFVFSVLFLTASFRFAEAFFRNALTDLDVIVLRWFERIHFETGDCAFLVLTRFGNTSILLIVLSCVSLSFVVWRRYFEAALLAGGAALAALSMVTTKWLIGRPRPASPAVRFLDGSPAFPSGHVAVGGVVYVVLAYLLARELQSRTARALLVGCGVVFTLLLAWTRLYFGVHWGTDVLGGLVLAGLWLGILIPLIIRHQRLNPLRVSPFVAWQVVLQSVLVIALAILLLRFVHP